MTYTELKVKKDYLESKYKEYLFEVYGTSNMWEISDIIRHSFLSLHMEVEQEKKFRIGKAVDKFDYENLKAEITAMEQYYVWNPDKVDLDAF